MSTYLEMLIDKYETALRYQREFQKVTPSDQVAQHQLLDQNVAIFREVVEDLKELQNMEASASSK